jgi:hypothetical protein
MGIFDKVKALVGKHENQIDDGIDKAATVADDKVGDKVGRDKIDMAQDKAHDAVDKLGES